MPKKRTALKIPVAVEPEICPEAVRGWTDGLAKYKKKSKMAREAARKHLSAMGWKFWRARQKGGNPGDLRYESPAGKNYYLLKTACQACVDLDLTGVESTGSNSSSDPNSPMEEKQETMPRKRGRPKKSGIKMKVGVVLPKKRGRKRKIDVVTPEEVHQSTEIGPEPERRRKNLRLLIHWLLILIISWKRKIVRSQCVILILLPRRRKREEERGR